MATAAVSRSSKALVQSRLSNVLEHLNQQPKLQLYNVKKLHIRWNAKNNSFGARNFVKDALPRIRWANPSLAIAADRVWTERIKQIIELTFSSGETQTIEMDEKKAGLILTQLMDLAGGDPWQAYKAERRKTGQPLFPGIPKPSTDTNVLVS